MHSYFLELGRLTSAILAIPAWRAQQGLVILSEALLSFLALFLLDAGVPEIQVLMLFAGVFLASGLLVRLHRTRALIALPGAFLPIALGAISLVSTGVAFLTSYPAAIAGGVLGVMTLKDLATTNAVGEVHRTAERAGFPPSRLVSTGMLVGAVLMIFMLTGSSRLLSAAPAVWMFLAAGACGVLLVLLLRGRIRLTAPAEDIAIPSGARLTCLLSALYNATSFVGRRFVLPVAVAKMARELDLGAGAYSTLGTILSLLVLLGLSLRGLSGRGLAPRAMMFSGFFAGLVLWVILARLIATPGGTWPAAIAALICLLLIEITAKIWTLGFIETLRLQARQDESKGAELAYFTYFMELKGYGAAAGFLIVLAGLAVGTSLLGATACLGIVLGLFILWRTHGGAPSSVT